MVQQLGRFALCLGFKPVCQLVKETNQARIAAGLVALTTSRRVGESKWSGSGESKVGIKSGKKPRISTRSAGDRGSVTIFVSRLSQRVGRLSVRFSV